jgi:hypothetical protein
MTCSMSGLHLIATKKRTLRKVRDVPGTASRAAAVSCSINRELPTGRAVGKRPSFIVHKRKAVAEAQKIVAIWNARQAGGREL